MTPGRVQQLHVWLSPSKPLLPVSASGVNHFKKKKKATALLESHRLGFCVLGTVLIHFPLYSYWNRKKKKMRVSANHRGM